MSGTPSCQVNDDEDGGTQVLLLSAASVTSVVTSLLAASKRLRSQQDETYNGLDGSSQHIPQNFLVVGEAEVA